MRFYTFASSIIAVILALSMSAQATPVPAPEPQVKPHRESMTSTEENYLTSFQLMAAGVSLNHPVTKYWTFAQESHLI